MVCKSYNHRPIEGRGGSRILKMGGGGIRLTREQRNAKKKRKIRRIIDSCKIR